MGEETGKWVVIAYYHLTPCVVYGLFDTEKEAWDYANANYKKMGCEVWDVRSVLNAFYEEAM